MRLFLFTVLIASAFALPSGAWAYSPQWFQCRQHQDCVKAAAACGRMRAVNKAYLQPYEAFVKKEGKLVSCTKPTKLMLALDKASVPFCRKNQCALNQPKVKYKTKETKKKPAAHPAKKKAVRPARR